MIEVANGSLQPPCDELSRNGNGRLRVLIADHDRLARSMIRTALCEVAHDAIVLTPRDGREALELARYHRPVVAIVDIGLPPEGDVELIRQVLRRGPETRVLTVSVDDERSAIAALRAGAVGHVGKDIDPEELASLVLRAADGEAIVPQKLLIPYACPPVEEDAVKSEERHPKGIGGRPNPSERTSRATPVVGYASMSSQRGERPRTEFSQQAEAIASECDQRGLLMLELVREREPARGRALERPGLGYALKLISDGEAKGLVVAELSRLTHSVPELGRVLEWLSRADARLVDAASGIDTEEATGRLAVRTIIEVSRWEHERLVERTRKGMRAARSKGPRGVADYPELRERIGSMRAEGMTLQAIADRLNEEGVPTVRGGAKWRPSSVQAAAGYRRPAAGETPDSPGRPTEPDPSGPPAGQSSAQLDAPQQIRSP